MAAKATGTHQAVEDCHLVLPNGVNHFVQPLRALGHFQRLGGQILQAAASCQHSKGPAELMLKPAWDAGQVRLLLQVPPIASYAACCSLQHQERQVVTTCCSRRLMCGCDDM
jgi:hypothetical protein